MSSQGYNKKFLGKSLGFPTLNKSYLAPLVNGRGNEIKYIHYSAFVHKERLLPLMTAVNIKGEAYSAPIRAGDEPWGFCEQIDIKYQLAGSFYSNDLNTFDRGHLVRRVDPCWGDTDLSLQAEGQTYRWINCTPQHKKLNQKGGVWYELEQHVLENGVKNKIADISVFSGPVLDNNDKIFIKKYKGNDLKIPIVFWKVIVWKKNNGKLYAVGFMMSQYEWVKKKLKDVTAPQAILLRRKLSKLEDDYFEKLKFNDHKTYQVSLRAIEKATGIKFNWSNVSFPYKAHAFKAIKAITLKKVYSIDSLLYKQLNISSTHKGVSLPSPVFPKRELSQAEITKRLKSGFQATMKRYSLKNVKL